MAATPGTPAGVAPVSSSLTDMFVTFLKIGAFTFGGGWAMISIIEREVVKRHQWLDKEEFLDLLAVSQSLPGILAVNIADNEISRFSADAV